MSENWDNDDRERALSWLDDERPVDGGDVYDEYVDDADAAFSTYADDERAALDSLDDKPVHGPQVPVNERPHYRPSNYGQHPVERETQLYGDSHVPVNERPHYRPAEGAQPERPLNGHYGRDAYAQVQIPPTMRASDYQQDGYQQGAQPQQRRQVLRQQPAQQQPPRQQAQRQAAQQPAYDQPLGLSDKEYRKARKRAEKDAARQSRAVDKRVSQQAHEAERRADKRARKQAVKQQKKALRRTRASVGKRIRRTILAVLILALVACGLYLHALDKNMHINDPELKEALTGTALPWKPYYVLIVGSDAREDEASRTDTIILARIDPRAKQVTLVSIPRDTMVDIPGYGTSKINAAHAYGGPALTVEVVSQFAGVPIAHYIEVGFGGFVDVVDAVGGVTVDVPPGTEVDGVMVPEGIQRLNGEQALIFVRCRKTYAAGDLQRAANQRAFMVALSSEILSAPPYRWPGLGLAVSKCISTDMYSAELLLMALELRGMDMNSMYTAVVPSYTDTIDGVSYVVADQEAWDAMMARIDAGQDPNAG